MFHMGAPSRRKNPRINCGIIKRFRPGRKSFALTLFALVLSTLLSFGPGETRGIAAAPNGPYGVDNVIFTGRALDLYTTGQWAPYVRPQDSFMLLSGNNSGQIDTDKLNSWAATLKNRYPSVDIYAAASGIDNVHRGAPRLNSNLFTGFMMVYEPNQDNAPEFTWDGAKSVAIWKEAARVIRANGMEAWGKPSGRAAEGRHHSRDWDYGDFAKVMDGQNVQTQGSCRDRDRNGSYTEDFKEAVDSIVSQYKRSGANSHLFVQVTTSSDAANTNATSPQDAFDCVVVGWKYPEVERVTLWSAIGDQESIDRVERFLQLREKLLVNQPPTPTPTPGPSIPSSHALPGCIEADHYKVGGEGVGYHDTTSGNDGGQFRFDNVDIQVTTDVGGGYNVGWIDPGEWLAFTVEVAQSGRYD